MDIKKTTISGIISIGSSKIIQQGINFVVTIILANLLNPQDFGLIGIVTVFVGFISVFSNLGLGSALVQRKNINEVQISTLFWINMMGGAASALIIVLAAYPISLFYKEPLLINLTLTLSLNFLITPFYQINRKLLEKELRFQAIAIISIIGILVSGLAGVLAAFLGFGVWSLVIQSISLNLSYLALFQLMKNWTPHFMFDFGSCTRLIRFGLNMVGIRLTAYLERNIDILLIGKLLGATQLGYYALAYRVMFFPIRQISYTFTDVLFPIFSKVQDELSVIQNGYLKSIRFTSLVTFPLMMIVFLLSEDFVLIVFGEQWLPAATIIRILAPAGAIQSITQIGGAIFPALDRPDIRMKLGIFNCILLAISLMVGAHWGIRGVAYAVFFCRVAAFVISQVILSKTIKLSFISIVKCLTVSILGCAILWLVNLGLKSKSILLASGGLTFLIISLGLYSIIYCLYLALFDKKDVQYIKAMSKRTEAVNGD